MLPALRRVLVDWQVGSPHAQPHELVMGTADGKPVAERNLRRALEVAKKQAGFDELEDRLSWHSLRHSFASILATDLELPATTLARLTGHADAGFTLDTHGHVLQHGARAVFLVQKVSPTPSKREAKETTLINGHRRVQYAAVHYREGW